MRTLALLVMIAVSAAGCFSRDTLCREEACPPPPLDPCEGQCAPFIGGPWSFVLVATDASTPPRCPLDVAPFEAMRSTAPPVTACGVHEEDGACSSPGYACLPPAPPPWSVCVIRDGAHGCQAPYSVPVEVEADAGATVCCLAPPDEPG